MSQEMKGFISFTDNDWCAFLAQQLLLTKTVLHKNGG
jgi:uncharacterized Rossmann fold enzyme